jgi:hypothetical protein
MPRLPDTRLLADSPLHDGSHLEDMGPLSNIGSHLPDFGSHLPEIWVPFEEAEETLTRPPFPQGGVCRMHRTPFWKSQTDLRTVSPAISLIQPVAGRNCSRLHHSVAGSTGKLFKNCKLSMIFLVLIPLVNYYS